MLLQMGPLLHLGPVITLVPSTAPPRIFEHLKNGIITHFNRFLPLKGHLEFSGAFFLAEIFEKVSFDPYNFRISRLLARKFEQMKNFLGIQICL